MTFTEKKEVFFEIACVPIAAQVKAAAPLRSNLPKCSAVPKSSGYRTFTFLQDLHRVSNFEWEAMLDGPSETGQH